LRDVVYRYGDHVALAIPQLEVSLRRPIGITGPNGSGKTTLACLIAGVLAPTAGSLELDGIASVLVDPEQIAFLPQSPVLIDAFSVEENIRLVAPRVSRAEIERELAQLGLTVPLSRTMSELSRGEQRRVALARALLKKPQLLILDEPDAWLDAAGRALLVSRLKQEDGQRSIIFVSHRADLLPLARTVLALDRGQSSVSFQP
jgi:ABC-type multidrug transport system ATPase subunit